MLYFENKLFTLSRNFGLDKIYIVRYQEKMPYWEFKLYIMYIFQIHDLILIDPIHTNKSVRDKIQIFGFAARKKNHPLCVLI